MTIATILADSTARRQFARNLKRNTIVYCMLVPGVAYCLIFRYVPMWGILIAFKDYNLYKGFSASPWIGMQTFRQLFALPNFGAIVFNTLRLNLLNLLFGFPAPILLALMMNEIHHRRYLRTMQSILYLPHFFSWVILGSIIVDIMSPNYGIVNTLLCRIGLLRSPIYFMGVPHWWIFVYILGSIWKGAGWGAIIYMAAISGIDPEMYEAAQIEGAGRFRRMWHITLPMIRPTVATMLILRMGDLLTIGFEQPFILSNPLVYSVSEVISTFVYKVGVQGARYSLTTAMGFFQSLVGLVMVFLANAIVRKLGEEGIF